VEEFLSGRREEEVVEVFMKCGWEGNGGCAGQTVLNEIETPQQRTVCRDEKGSLQER
jgi:hypothetical protein